MLITSLRFSDIVFFLPRYSHFCCKKRSPENFGIETECLLVPRPHCARPMRFGSRGPSEFLSLSAVRLRLVIENREGLGRRRTGMRQRPLLVHVLELSFCSTEICFYSLGFFILLKGVSRIW